MTTTTKRKPGPRRHRMDLRTTDPIEPGDHGLRPDAPKSEHGYPVPLCPEAYAAALATPKPKPEPPQLAAMIHAEGGTVTATFTNVTNRQGDVAAAVAELRAAFIAKIGALKDRPEAVAVARLQEQEAHAAGKFNELQAIAESLQDDLESGGDDATIAALSKKLAATDAEVRARETVLAAIRRQLPAALEQRATMFKAELHTLVSAELDETGEALRMATKKLWDLIADRLVRVQALTAFREQMPGRTSGDLEPLLVRVLGR